MISMITRNCSLDRFGSQIKNKKIICFGAGATGQVLVGLLEDSTLDEILYFIDNDERLWGVKFKLTGGSFL